MSISEGDKVKASGKVVRINGRRVLLADRLQAGGRTFNVGQPLSSGNRSSRSSAYQSSSSSQSQRGRVEQTRNVRSQDGDKTLLFIRLDDGRTAIVDLDPHMSLSRSTRSTGSAPSSSSGSSSSAGSSSSSGSGKNSNSESDFNWNPSSWPSNAIAPSDYTDDNK